MKRLAQRLWTGLTAWSARRPFARPSGREARVWYGGARIGAIGGPSLKLAKLGAVFPEHRFGYNLVYALSAAPFLSEAAYARLAGLGVPTVLNQNGVFYPAWFEGDCEARNRPMAIAHARADHVFYQSEFCRQASLRFLGPRNGPSDILYNAIDTEFFAPAKAPPSGPLAILVTGRIDPHQSYRLVQAIEGLAVARHSGLEAVLRVAGAMAPAVEAAARQVIARHGLEEAVVLSGTYSQVEAPALYRQAHAYLTLTHQDACPSAVIEAMASGLPVIHPTSGGTPELVGEAGIALPTGEDWQRPLVPSAEAIGRAMLAMAETRDRLAPLARARAVAHFDLAAWLERHRRLFHELLARHG